MTAWNTTSYGHTVRASLITHPCHTPWKEISTLPKRPSEAPIRTLQVDLDALEDDLWEAGDLDDLHGWIDALRALPNPNLKIEIHNAPHTLAHVLYRIGALEDGALILIDPREELPYG